MYKIITQNRDGMSIYGIEHIGSGQRIEDITNSYSDIEWLVCVINREGLDPIHLQDVVDDFLTEAKILEEESEGVAV